MATLTQLEFFVSNNRVSTLGTPTGNYQSGFLPMNSILYIIPAQCTAGGGTLYPGRSCDITVPLFIVSTHTCIMATSGLLVNSAAP